MSVGSNLTGILIRGKCHTTSEAESGEMQLHAKERQGLTASTRSQEEARKDSPTGFIGNQGLQGLQVYQLS